MNWFYLDGGEQRGPVSDSQLGELLRSGKIDSTTMVQREGMTDWQPLGVARPVGTICAECGKSFPPDELILLNNAPVCAACKPIFLQRLQEGAAMPSTGNLWRMGKRVVSRTETIFPDRCVKCNAPANGYRLKRQLYWMYPAYYLFLLCNVLILLVVYLVVRKKAVVHIGLCERHRSLRKNGMIIGLSGLFGGVGLLILAAALESGWMAWIGLFLLLVVGITGGVMARTVGPAKIDKEYVWLTGVHKDFLADLPEWRG